MASLPQNYFETQVLTAPPQKLQLMMIEAAIRFGRLAAGHWEADEGDRACEALIRAQQIVTELVNGLNRDESPQLAKKMAAVYLFVFRSLTEACQQRDRVKLDDALRVLEIERETWREVCQRIGRDAGSENEAAVVLPSLSMTAGDTAALPDTAVTPIAPDTTAGFSLEA
jgi:flagellar biosynthetic protein FliS